MWLASITQQLSQQLYEVGEAEDNTPTISFTVPRSESSGLINNKRELFAFRLDTTVCIIGSE